MMPDWRKLGEFFGFPTCCIDYFIGRDGQQMKKDFDLETSWSGTGYIPCPTCRPKAEADFEKFVAEVIQPNRECSTPFPDGSWSDG